MRKFTTACGGTIVVPQKAEEHLLAHPEVENILAEAIARVVLPPDGAPLSLEVEMGRIVGRSGRTTTPLISPKERTLFAQRVGRDWPSRVFVGEGEETTKVVLLAQPSSLGARTYLLVSGWIGTLARKEPWDPTIKNQIEYQECLDFWCSEALIYDSATMGAPFETTWEKILEQCRKDNFSAILAI